MLITAAKGTGTTATATGTGMITGMATTERSDGSPSSSPPIPVCKDGGSTEREREREAKGWQVVACRRRSHCCYSYNTNPIG
mmetsp:Transcript_42065/g.48622  ORF Transcript_42065/g.48622 Transcript_42065/m.48622 type:complete len:82 (-) Transcript_42065:5-250(-)